MAEKGQQRSGTDHRQHQDARFLEPVPAAALAEHIGETEQARREQREPEPVERTLPNPGGHGVVGDEQKAGRRQGQRYHAEEDPGPGLAVDQPPLQGWREGRRRDHRRNGEQRLQDRLKRARIAAKDDRLARHQ